MHTVVAPEVARLSQTEYYLVKSSYSFIVILAEQSLEEKLQSYKKAHREIAYICNHQRAIPNGFYQKISALEEKVDIVFNCILDLYFLILKVIFMMLAVTQQL